MKCLSEIRPLDSTYTYAQKAVNKFKKTGFSIYLNLKKVEYRGTFLP